MPGSQALAARRFAAGVAGSSHAGPIGTYCTYGQRVLALAGSVSTCRRLFLVQNWRALQQMSGARLSRGRYPQDMWRSKYASWGVWA